ncbi:hypothetical protein DRO32_01660, partial [Candidatus Bathyarchaeota archaeon]
MRPASLPLAELMACLSGEDLISLSERAPGPEEKEGLLSLSSSLLNLLDRVFCETEDDEVRDKLEDLSSSLEDLHEALLSSP